MLILGITGGIELVHEFPKLPFESGLGHDTAAVLMESGKVIAGIEEERITRIKHTNKIWASSVRYCLESANKTLQDLNAIAFYASEEHLNHLLKHFQTQVAELNQFTNVRHLYQYLFEREFGYKVNERIFEFIDHHQTHAAATYYMSGFNSCLILIIDGEGEYDDAGEYISTSVINATNSNFNTLSTKSTPHSLGHFYLKIIHFLGYGEFDEYKVMGLAPYGKGEKYRKQFEQFYSLLPNGDYVIHIERITSLSEILAPRKQDEPFSQAHKDIAAALQEALEDIVFHLLRYYQTVTKHKRLAIGGGVGQNSSMNGKILRSGLFEEVFAPSFAGDSGCAYGAAAHVTFKKQPELPHSQVLHAYWGTSIYDNKIYDALSSWQHFLEIEKMENTVEKVTDLIIEGAVIGWIQGRSEFGPRALGNRSILADPRIASHKETINAMIKKREAYRPFAPSILEERISEFFNVPGENSIFPFMSFVLEVKPEWRERLPAITHVDGTARLQTVNKEINQRYWELINTFGKKTGIPILLNTSFNNNAEPIVDSITDAIVCYLTSGLDYLVVGDYLMTKKNWGKNELLQLSVNLPKAGRLISEDYYINSNNRGTDYYFVWNYKPDQKFNLTKEWYSILQTCQDNETLASLTKKLGFTTKQRDLVICDLPELWSDRIIILAQKKSD